MTDERVNLVWQDDTCPTCHGSGVFYRRSGAITCPFCDGSGTSAKQRALAAQYGVDIAIAPPALATEEDQRVSVPQWNDGTKPSPAPWTMVRSETPYASWIMDATGAIVCGLFGERDEAILLAAQPLPQDDTPIFEPDPPDVIKANQRPVTSEWLSAAYVAIFGASEPLQCCVCSDSCDGVRGSASCVAGKP